jgi:hypothetical protein
LLFPPNLSSLLLLRYFGDCLYDTRDYVSFGVGVLSMAIWTVALLPQVCSFSRLSSTRSTLFLFLISVD